MLVYYTSVTDTITGGFMDSKPSLSFFLAAISKTFLALVLTIGMLPMLAPSNKAFADDSQSVAVRDQSSDALLPAEDRVFAGVESDFGNAGDGAEAEESPMVSEELDSAMSIAGDPDSEMQGENSFRFKDGVPIRPVEGDSDGMMRSRDLSLRGYGSSYYPSFGYGPCSGGDAIRGVDVSSYQGAIDWIKVKSAGVDYAILRCATGYQGGRNDTQFETNVKNCKIAGMPFGTYYYSYATNPSQGVEDANRVIAQLRAAKVSASDLSYPIYYDLEDSTVGSMSSSAKAELARNFVTTLRNAGYSKIGIYSSLNWWCTQLTDPYFDSADLYRWVAHYTFTGLGHNPDGSIYGGGRVNRFHDFRARGDVWQFSSLGRVSGISGDVDLDYSCYGMVPYDAPDGSMFRMYNPNSGEHFYTVSANEGNNLFRHGWNYEGIAWTAPSWSNKPVYRMYNPNAGDHHYTLSANERDNLIRHGWNYEGVGWYSDDYERSGLHRLYNPNAWTGTHHYTLSTNERDWLVRLGWRYEGIGWYGM